MGTPSYVFNYNTWVSTFPELAGVSEAQATLYFYSFAQLYVRNDGGGPVNDPTMQAGLLNLTTAHIARLFSSQTNGVSTTGGSTSPSPLVGRIATATEGTVTVNTEMPDQQPNAAWWNQTPYGAAVWVALKPFRTFRYLPSVRQRVYDPPYGYPRYGFRGGGGVAPLPPPPPPTTHLTNVGGWLVVDSAADWPTDSDTPGALYSNGGLVTVVPGVVPDPTAPPVFFGITADVLLALGGGNLPLDNPGPGSGQLYNQGGVVVIA